MGLVIMNYIEIDPMDFPMDKGESWWLVHPNNPNSEFRVPIGAVTLCTQNILDFAAGRMYKIIDNDSNNGWVTISCQSLTAKMPYYVFARYFDAECFVRGTFSVEGKRTEPFDYKPTLERFEDKK